MPERSEKAEERLCDQLIAKLGGQVVHFSHPGRTMQTPGIPDRRYRIHNAAVFWECKRADGQLSTDQVTFLMAEVAHGAYVGCGDLDELVKYVEFLRKWRDEPTATVLLGPTLYGTRLVAKWKLTAAQRRKAT